MDWVRDFYSKQTLWLGLEERWARISVDDLQGRPVNRTAAIERFAGSGAKRVLELGCGSGIVAGAMVTAGHTVVAVENKRVNFVQPGRGRAEVIWRHDLSEKTLSDIGISKDQSSQFQKLAQIPKPEFERLLNDAVTNPGADPQNVAGPSSK